jgi:diacylglycerol kinase (ATP)
MTPAKKIYFIVNPVAGRGRAAAAGDWISERMKATGREYEISVTDGPGDAVKLAAWAVKHADAVVAVGGDGTVNEVVNGLYPSGVPLGVIPMGSGNDFVKMIGIPSEPEAALEVVLGGVTRSIDIGRINDRIFTNSVGIGLDAAVARTMNRTRWLRGKAAYHYSVYANIAFYRNKVIVWSADDESGASKSILVAVMNGTTYGGDFRVAPRAVCDDGLLDMVVGGNYGLLGRLRVLPKFQKGLHLGLPKITWRQAKKVKVTSEHSIPVQVDGELLPDPAAGTVVEIEVLPRALTVLAVSEN